MLLRFFQRGDTAAAAFVHVGSFGPAAAKRRDGWFRRDSHFMLGSVTVVDNFLGMLFSAATANPPCIAVTSPP
jgi:hypothetical protein